MKYLLLKYEISATQGSTSNLNLGYIKGIKDIDIQKTHPIKKAKLPKRNMDNRHERHFTDEIGVANEPNQQWVIKIEIAVRYHIANNDKKLIQC